MITSGRCVHGLLNCAICHDKNGNLFETTTSGKSGSVDGYVELPSSLTAENGAKGLLSGEFFETIEVENSSYCGCGKCDYCEEFPDEPEYVQQRVPVSWTTIKEIYAMIVKNYT